jgi:hypothetical protein
LPNFVNFMRFLHPGSARPPSCLVPQQSWVGMGPCCIVKGRGTLCLAWPSIRIPGAIKLVVPCLALGPVLAVFREQRAVHFFSDAVVCLTPHKQQTSTQNGPEQAEFLLITLALRTSCGQAPRRRRCTARLRGSRLNYHTRQDFSGYIGCPLVQPKALPNSSKFCTDPFTRHLPGE